MSEQDGKNTNRAEEALKNVARKTKNKIVQKIVSIVIPYAIPIVLIIFAGALLLGVFNAVGDTVQNIVDEIINFFTIDHEGAISVTDTQVDTIINSITDMGIDMDGLKLMGDIDYSNPDAVKANQDALREYIKSFYEAQAITQTLNTKPGWFENWTKGDKVYGTVYVYRVNEGATSSNDKFQLDYLKLEEFNEKVKNNATDARKYFTMNEDGNLVFAVKEIKDGNSKVVASQPIDYKTAISQYTTQMNFFLYLAMITENPEFVSAVADLVKDSEIDITIMENTTETITSGTMSYDCMQQTYTNNSGAIIATGEPTLERTL